jgi:hypothetical protein
VCIVPDGLGSPLHTSFGGDTWRSFEDLKITEVGSAEYGSSTRVSLGRHDSITFLGVTGLDASDFVFV